MTVLPYKLHMLQPRWGNVGRAAASAQSEEPLCLPLRMKSSIDDVSKISFSTNLDAEVAWEMRNTGLIAMDASHSECIFEVFL